MEEKKEKVIAIATQLAVAWLKSGRPLGTDLGQAAVYTALEIVEFTEKQVSS